MKKASKIILGTIAVISIGIGITAFSCGPKHHFGNGFSDKHAAKIVERISGKLNLDQTQNAKLTVVKNKLVAKMQEVKSGEVDRKQNLLSLFSGTLMDRERAINMVSQKTDLIAQNAPEMINVIGDFYDSLNVEQQQTVKDLLQKKFDGHGRGRFGRH